MSLTDPAEDAANDARMTELTLTAGGIRRPGQSPDPSPTVAARVTKRLTDAWGWLPDEPEAVTLGTNFAQAAHLLTTGTRTTADNLLDALIDGPTHAAVTVKPGRDALIEAMSAALHVSTDRIPGLRVGPVLSADTQSVEVAADAVLAILPGKTVAQVRADALRDAADAWNKDFARAHGNRTDVFLRLRADEEAGK